MKQYKKIFTLTIGLCIVMPLWQSTALGSYGKFAGQEEKKEYVKRHKEALDIIGGFAKQTSEEFAKNIKNLKDICKKSVTAASDYYDAATEKEQKKIAEQFSFDAKMVKGDSTENLLKQALLLAENNILVSDMLPVLQKLDSDIDYVLTRIKAEEKSKPQPKVPVAQLETTWQLAHNAASALIEGFSDLTPAEVTPALVNALTVGLKDAVRAAARYYNAATTTDQKKIAAQFTITYNALPAGSIEQTLKKTLALAERNAVQKGEKVAFDTIDKNIANVLKEKMKPAEKKKVPEELPGEEVEVSLTGQEEIKKTESGKLTAEELADLKKQQQQLENTPEPTKPTEPTVQTPAKPLPIVPAKPIVPIKPIVPPKPIVPIKPIVQTPTKPIVPPKPIVQIPTQPIVPPKPIVPIKPPVQPVPDSAIQLANALRNLVREAHEISII